MHAQPADPDRMPAGLTSTGAGAGAGVPQQTGSPQHATHSQLFLSWLAICWARASPRIAAQTLVKAFVALGLLSSDLM